MTYDKVLELIKDEKTTVYLSLPGLVSLGKIPEPCELPMEKQLALGLLNSVYKAFTDNGYTMDVINFNIACSGSDVIFLSSPAFVTLH